MSVFTYFLAASDANKTLNAKEAEAFVADLLRKQMVRFPAAILVGEACNMASVHWDEYGGDEHSEYWAHANTYIVPNNPGSMLDYGDPESDLLWYRGSNEQVFFAMLKQLPLGEKDCCICFPSIHEQLTQMGWNGATIYLLTHPFPMEFRHPVGRTDFVALVDRPLAHYFILSSLSGGEMDQEANPLEPLLKRYFGLHLLTGETQ